jgi:hypothetical protein
MTDAEFLDEYVEQMIAILEDALKHDSVAPPVPEDAREREIWSGGSKLGREATRNNSKPHM